MLYTHTSIYAYNNNNNNNTYMHAHTKTYAGPCMVGAALVGMVYILHK